MGLIDYYTGELVCRQLSADDDELQHVEALLAEAFSDAATRMGHPYTDLNELKGRIAMGFEIYGFYDSSEKLIATVHVSQKHRDDPRLMYFGRLAVAGTARGQVAAKAIIEAIIRYAKSRDKEAIGINYFSASPHLKSYYARFGFMPDGEPFYWETEELNPLLLTL